MSSSERLIELIPQLGREVVGLEIGVRSAINLVYILESCPNIIKMYAVDPYAPYQDGDIFIDQAFQDSVKQQAIQLLKEKDLLHKVEFIQLMSDDAASLIQDNSLDFIFIDGNHDYEYTLSDLNNYYNKVRNLGIISGHDLTPEWPGVAQALEKFLPEKGMFLEQNVQRLGGTSWFFQKL
jgi:hypothetical protein